MNLPPWLATPLCIVLFKWTCLLTLAWGLHGVLRHRHARWRLILWRSVLCFSLILPFTQFIAVPGIQIPLRFAEPASAPDIDSPPPLTVSQKPPGATTAQTVRVPPIVNAPAFNGPPAPLPEPARHTSRTNVAMVIWTVGCLLGLLRLGLLHARLAWLRKLSSPAPAELRRLAGEIQIRLKVRRTVVVRVSGAVASPFVCGLFQPVIILPLSLADELPPGELTALLSHEFAHLRQHDLYWCVGWRWFTAVFWFHPLVWNIPAAHNLACEQEADRMASGQMAAQEFYAPMLARLALRVLALPRVETHLTLNGSAHIARRLRHLGKRGMDAWTWKRTVAGFTLAGFLFAGIAGCQCRKSVPTGREAFAKITFKTVSVQVQDEDGQPIASATVLPHAFRVKGVHGADAYGWNTNLFGPPEKAVTDADGRASVRYPVEGIPEEKEFTGALCLSISHPEFASADIQSYSVDSPEQPIHLTRGIQLTVSAYYGPEHQPLADFIPTLADNDHTGDWQKETDGTWQYHKLSPGGHLLQLMGRLPSGEIVYSDAQPVTAERGKECRFDVEMKPGIRLEGHLDNQVPRPVKHGRVMISVRPKEYPALNVIEDYYAADEKWGGRRFWHSYRPIGEDGSFAFETIPPGTADIVVLGDGFVSKTMGELHNRVGGMVSTNGPIVVIPQAFPLASPVAQIEIITEPTATLDFTTTTQSGEPIAGVRAGIWPMVFRMWGQCGWDRDSSEAPYRTIPNLPDPVFYGETDHNGRLVLTNLPAEHRGLEVWGKNFQVPLQNTRWRDRNVRAKFSPGETNVINMKMEPVGTDFIGK